MPTEWIKVIKIGVCRQADVRSLDSSAMILYSNPGGEKFHFENYKKKRRVGFLGACCVFFLQTYRSRTVLGAPRRCLTFY